MDRDDGIDNVRTDFHEHTGKEKSLGSGRISNQDTRLDSEPDEPLYGWIVTACVFVINGHTWGLNSSYSVFLAYYIANNTFPGASSLDYAFVGGLSVANAMLLPPLATWTTRVYGTKVTLMIGIFFETLSFIGASFATKFVHVLLSQGICFGWGMSFLFTASVGIIPQWFTKRRSLANGIGAAGSGIFGMVYALAANTMIEKIGLQWAFRILGVVAFTANVVCTLLIKDRNLALGASLHGFDICLLRRREFWMLLGYGFFSMLGYIVLLFSLPNYANSIGLTGHQGSVVGALLNLGQGIGRPPIGYFSDTVGRINIAAASTFLCGVFCLVIWTNARTYGVLIFYALLGGTVAGTFWPTVGPVTAEVVGLQLLPAALSITWVNLVLPTTFSEPIAFEMVQHTGGYLSAQLFTGVMYIVAGLCLLLLKAWKHGQLEDLDTTQGKRSGIRTSYFKRMFSWEKV